MGNDESSAFQYKTAKTESSSAGGCEKFHMNQSYCTIKILGTEVIWSARGINSIAPVQRIAHATAYSPETDHAYIAYGVSEDNVFLKDVWDLDLKTCKWRKIPIDENKVRPCAGSRAVIVGNYLWIYGGFHETEYIDDLHVINVNTGEIARPKTTGQGPMPCSGHSMTYANGKIYLFGGYGNQPYFQLKVLDLKTFEWTSIRTTENKYSHGFCVCNGATYLNGGSKVNDIVRIDHATQEVSYIKPKGASPPATLSKSSLVGVGQYMVLVGGSSKKNDTFLPMRVYNTQTNTWSVLQVMPDGFTTTMSDGEIDKNRIFRLPVCTDSSAVYREKDREIAMFQGKPFREPPVIITFKMGDAIAFLNHQSDMIAALQF